MKKLDTSRPYGLVCGISENGARYEQDGISFDTHGNEIGAKPEEPEGGDETPAPDGPYTSWTPAQMRQEIIRRTGRRPKNGTSQEAMIRILQKTEDIAIAPTE